MKPTRYEQVTAGYVAYDSQDSIIGVLKRMDDQSIQHTNTIKRVKTKNRASERVVKAILYERG